MDHRRFGLALLLLVAVATPAAGQKPAGRPADVAGLIRALQGREFNEAFAAAEALGRVTTDRARVVAALVDALRGREWANCSADVRDAAARSLAELKAKEAVGPLLELVKSGKPLEHECVE